MPTRLPLLALLLACCCAPASAQQIKGSVLDPSPANLARTWDGASLTLPARAGRPLWQGRLDQAQIDPAHAPAERAAVVVLMHGSSGNAGFIKDYQRWLAEDLGLPSIAPDSFAIADRLTYTSPIDKPTYERVHALRLAELRHALEQARGLAWVDPARIVVVGTSEGAVPVARLADPGPLARVMYAWSCEANYFVEEPRTAIPKQTPVLAMIAVKDPYFSRHNTWSGSAEIIGTCARALEDHAAATVVTLSTDKHTIMNFPEAREITGAFLRRALAAPRKPD